MYFSILNIFFLLTIIYQSIGSEWNYGDEGPDVWSDLYPLCDGQSQSPINIDTTSTVYHSVQIFKFSAGYSITQNFKLINNGHSISGTYTGNDPSLLTLTGGGLNGTYQFSSFHLHWGENYKSSSEHQV
jgi:carbonic anhydrase